MARFRSAARLAPAKDVGIGGYIVGRSSARPDPFAIQRGTRVLLSLWDSLMFGRVPGYVFHRGVWTGTRSRSRHVRLSSLEHARQMTCAQNATPRMIVGKCAPRPVAAASAEALSKEWGVRLFATRLLPAARCTQNARC